MADNTIIILLVVGVVIFLVMNPDVLKEGLNKEDNSLPQNQTVVKNKEFIGKPVLDGIQFDCNFDSDCLFYNDDCNNDCNCDTVRGECYI